MTSMQVSMTTGSDRQLFCIAEQQEYITWSMRSLEQKAILQIYRDEQESLSTHGVSNLKRSSLQWTPRGCHCHWKLRNSNFKSYELKYLQAVVDELSKTRVVSKTNPSCSRCNVFHVFYVTINAFRCNYRCKKHYLRCISKSGRRHCLVSIKSQ